jgi:hypothetical protein
MGTAIEIVLDSTPPQQRRRRRGAALALATGLHTALFLAWGGMVAFGAAMDAEHEGAAKGAYKIVALTGAMMGSAHAAWVVGTLARSALVGRWDFLVLYSTDIRRGVSFGVFSALAFACIRLADGMTRSHSPFGHVARVFNSGLILAACFLALQATAVALFTYVFFLHRKKAWHSIAANEASVMDHPDISRAFTCTDVCVGISEGAPLGEFLRRWVGVSDSEVLAALPAQARGLHDTLCSLMRPDEAGSIERDEFMRYMITRRVDTADPGVERLWQLLSSGREDTAGTAITPSSVERLLYGMAFRRKRFAHQVFTDHKCIDWIMMDLGLLLYPFCAVIIADMWGYTGAFGEGFDMFKTYMLAASFVAAQLRERVLFMMTMAMRRPFDIGDILLIDGGPFRVQDFTTNHTHLDGSTAMTVRNSALLGGTILNLTRGEVKDKVVMAMPITAANDAVQRARDALVAYARANPDVVDEGSVRAGWVGVEGGSAKVMSVHWAYAFVVHDAGRFNATRTAVADHVVASLGTEAHLSGLGYVSAGGGAFNDHVAVREYMDRAVA